MCKLFPMALSGSIPRTHSKQCEKCLNHHCVHIKLCNILTPQFQIWNDMRQDLLRISGCGKACGKVNPQYYTSKLQQDMTIKDMK